MDSVLRMDGDRKEDWRRSTSTQMSDFVSESASLCSTYGQEDGDIPVPRRSSFGTSKGSSEFDGVPTGSPKWVHDWYSRHPDKNIKFSKSQCDVSRRRCHCSDGLNNCLRPCDDALIRCGQSCVRSKHLKKPFTFIAYALTSTTIIEIGPIFPLVLYGCFLDDIALICLIVIAAVVLLSQIPKRFAWRYRPFFDYRAVHMKTNKTSSFPSRAVVCAVAYSYIVALCLLNGPNYYKVINHTSPYDPFHDDEFRFIFTNEGFLYILPFLLTWVPGVAWSRVYLGVHYPSDCTFGAFLGLACCAIGEFAGKALRNLCLPCSTYQCYANATDCALAVLPNEPWDFRCYKYGLAAISALVLFVIFLLAIVPRVAFFTKSANVLGMVFPAIVFHLTMLCKPLAVVQTVVPTALAPPNITDEHVGRGEIHIVAASCFGILLVGVYFLMMVKSVKKAIKSWRVQLGIFTFLFFFILLSLCFYRVMVV